MSLTLDRRHAEAVAALSPADRRLWDAMGEAKPRYTVWPTAGACHELGACRVTAKMLGTPLMPWQEWTARIATERRLDDVRRYRYPFFLITVPRQAGKTTIVRVILLTRSILYVDRRAFYTAQTGKDARERWADLVSLATRKRSPLRPLLTVRKAAGSSRLTLDPTGSTLSPFAPTAESLHGYTPHDVALDELFAFSEADGDELLGAVIPAQGTLATSQLVGLSTAGNRDSTFLRRLVVAGRLVHAAALGVALEELDTGGRAELAAALGIRRDELDVSGIGPAGYVEWSLAPSLDPFDEGSWTFHPAYGLTQSVEKFREAVGSVPAGVWIRAYCNQWTEDSDPLFDMARYDACAGELGDPPPLSECVVGFGTAPDRSRVAAVIAWRHSSGRVAAMLLHASADLAGWVDYLAALAPSVRRLVGDDGGLNRVILDELRRGRPEGSEHAPLALDSREWQLASGGLHSAIEHRRLLVDGEPDDAGTMKPRDLVLRSGVERAVQRQMGESWALSHKGSPESVALAAALRGVETVRDTPKPEIYS